MNSTLDHGHAAKSIDISELVFASKTSIPHLSTRLRWMQVLLLSDGTLGKT
jgi:hypothetical protein